MHNLATTHENHRTLAELAAFRTRETSHIWQVGTLRVSRLALSYLVNFKLVNFKTEVLCTLWFLKSKVFCVGPKN